MLTGHQVGFHVAAHARSKSVPSADHHRTGLERRPGVGHDHDKEREHIQEESQENVKLLPVTLRHGVPAIPVEVQRGRLHKEETAIDQKGWEKDIRQISHQLRIEADEQEQQNTAEQCRRGVRRRQELGKLLGQLVVALVA